MKKRIFATILIFVFISGCNTLNIRNNTHAITLSKLDFKGSKWILNDAFEEEISSTDKFAWNFFSDYIKDSLFKLSEVKNKSAIMPGMINYDLQPQALNEIKNSTTCDFLIQIKFTVLSNQIKGFIGSVGTTSPTVKRNSVRTDLRIYDLNKSIIIWDTFAVSTFKTNVTDKHDWGLAVTIRKLKSSGLNKLFRIIDKGKL